MSASTLFEKSRIAQNFHSSPSFESLYSNIHTMSYQLLAMENPLLDIQCNATEELLNKYNLKANDAILADASHQPL